MEADISVLTEKNHAKLERVLERMFELHREGVISTEIAVGHLTTLIGQIDIGNVGAVDYLNNVIPNALKEGWSDDDA